VYDAIVAGLGAMGSAAAFHLARAGCRVVGFDRFTPPHALGSSHGKSRIIREAYFEDPLYVPLVQRAYECWAELEALSGRRLLTRTGGLMIGPRDGAVVRGARTSAVAHGLSCEELDARELARRVPGFRPGDDDVAIWEPRAGVLAPEAAIQSHLEQALRHGAELRFDEPVLGWSAAPGGVRVTSARGATDARTLVIAAGAWVRELVPALARSLVVERNVVCWFDPSRPTPRFAPEHFPVFIHEYERGKAWYGFPDLGDGVKLALHHQGEPVDPATVRRTVAPAEVARVRALARRYVPDADGPLREAAVCLYTNTPDEHFILDHHPDHPQVLVASPCSGHGFKFSSAIGEVIADLVREGRTRFDLRPFRLGRFANGVGRPDAGGPSRA